MKNEIKSLKMGKNNRWEKWDAGGANWVSGGAKWDA